MQCAGSALPDPCFSSPAFLFYAIATLSYGTEDLKLPHARASSRRGYSPDGSGGKGPFFESIGAGVMPVPSPSHPRARAVIAHAQPAGEEGHLA
ncbi:hypothetical protein EVAR_17826_1 [Eumeta japonica]|uniref:Uncharacterized protein n=1 Tax=Eumeta variegata TaxID=151549 RepID=A0A4C1TTK6_EUMVA|nr:hypothetical protein EVAR_17826_1 [Eumeta japonica]